MNSLFDTFVENENEIKFYLLVNMIVHSSSANYNQIIFYFLWNEDINVSVSSILIHKSSLFYSAS